MMNNFPKLHTLKRPATQGESITKRGAQWKQMSDLLGLMS